MSDSQAPEEPKGVTLIDPEDHDFTRRRIEDSMADAMKKYVHGYAYGGARLELGDLKYDGRDDYTLEEQRQALLSDRPLYRRLRGTVRLVDDETGEVLDEKKNFTLARVPWLTPRGTFINNGSEFAPVMQSRLLPGAYTRRRNDGKLETHVNTRPGTGPAMRVVLDPETGEYRLKVGASNLHAYSVFRDLGVSDEELARRWGDEVLEVNKAGYRKGMLDKMYQRAVPKWEREDNATDEQKREAVEEALKNAQVASSILRRNLPNLYSMRKAAEWRGMNRMLSAADRLEKSAADRMGFDPDFKPAELKEAFNALIAGEGPRLASMKDWPSEWLDSEGRRWLEWYEGYSIGKRGKDDDRQIARWKSFRRRHGALFRANPTPRRAFALMNWAVDPLKLLPSRRRAAFKKEMEAYRAREYMRWHFNRKGYDKSLGERMLRKARDRGAPVDAGAEPTEALLMRLASDGYLKPGDF